MVAGVDHPKPGVTMNEFATVRYDAALIPDPEFNLDGSGEGELRRQRDRPGRAVDSLLRIVEVGS